jgi:uncharacterized phiE125 gp8 family phage protein
MRPMLIGAPAVEPVSLAEAKSWLREDASDEDQLIQALVVSARMTLEAYTRRFFVAQDWRLIFDAWPPSVRADSTLIIPFAPFQTVNAIRIYDVENVAQVAPTTNYRAPAATEGGRIAFACAPKSPGRSIDAIEIDFTVGYGPLAIQTPEPLRRAILMLVAYWREKRGDDSLDALPRAVGQLAAPFRRERLS